MSVEKSFPLFSTYMKKNSSCLVREQHASPLANALCFIRVVLLGSFFAAAVAMGQNRSSTGCLVSPRAGWPPAGLLSSQCAGCSAPVTSGTALPCCLTPACFPSAIWRIEPYLFISGKLSFSNSMCPYGIAELLSGMVKKSHEIYPSSFGGSAQISIFHLV